MSATDSGLCTYAYEFFISYPQMAGENQRHLMDDFAAQLKTALDYNRQTSRIAMAFRDRDCLKPGYIWQEIIPRILCQSRSMLLVFNEEYFSREYCVMEFCAMQKLERLRGFAGRSGESLIIPLILQSKSNEKGEPLLPVPIARLSFVDFRMVRYPKKQFETKYVSDGITKLLRRLEAFQGKCVSPVIKCSEFTFEEKVQLAPPPPVLYPGEWQATS